MQRDFFWRGACGLAPTGGGAWLAISLKIGSSLVVKIHQIGTRTEIVARMCRFFFSRAACPPHADRRRG